MRKKRKKPFAATRASIKHLEADGWTCWVVESHIPKTFIKRDCFGFADILAVSPARGIMLVQSTGGKSTSNFHARVGKVKAEPRAAIWLAAGGSIKWWPRRSGASPSRTALICSCANCASDGW